jgi:hypothetical protein
MLSSILVILYEWRFVIAIILAVVLYALCNWKEFKSKLYALMLQAKSMAKDEVLKSGKEQEDWVVIQIYKYVPYVKFIPEIAMRKVVHFLYIKGKDYLDDGQMNGSITE